MTNKEKFELLQRILDNISRRLQFSNGVTPVVLETNRDLQDLAMYLQDQIEIDWT